MRGACLLVAVLCQSTDLQQQQELFYVIPPFEAATQHPSSGAAASTAALVNMDAEPAVEHLTSSMHPNARCRHYLYIYPCMQLVTNLQCVTLRASKHWHAVKVETQQ